MHDIFFFSSSVKMTASYTISIAFLFMLIQIFTETLSQQCINGGSEKSILGWKLQNHVYKLLKANFGYECVLICRQDSRCQSFNWVISLNMCEFSDRTKEARPEDFVPDPDRYYYRRDMNRGKFMLVRSLSIERSFKGVQCTFRGVINRETSKFPSTF